MLIDFKTRMVESSSALFNTHLIDTHRYKRPVAHSSSRASLTTTLLYRCYISDQPPLVSARSTNPWCAWLAALQVAPRCPIRAGSLHIVIPHLIITHVHRCTVLHPSLTLKILPIKSQTSVTTRVSQPIPPRPNFSTSRYILET